jgi:hypothetical protein
MILSIPDADTAEFTFSSPESESSAGLLLRVMGGEYEGRMVRLHSQKCTIGSSPSCTLRLMGRQFQPVHCLIVRGARGSVIRKWADNTQLNDADFLDSWLVPGDRLTIGPIQLEILADRLLDEVSGWHAAAELDEKLRTLRKLNRRRVKRLCKRTRATEQRLQEMERQLDEQRDRFLPLITDSAKDGLIDFHHATAWPAAVELLHHALNEKHQSLARLHRSMEQELEPRKLRLDEQFQQLLESQQHLQDDQSRLQVERRALLDSIEEQRTAIESQAARKAQEDWQAKVEELTRQCRAAAEERTRLELQRDLLESERLELAQHLDQLQDRVTRLEQELQQQAAKVAGPDWEAECASWKRRCEEATEDRERQIEALRIRVGELEDDLSLAGEELSAALQPRPAELSNEQLALTDRCQMLESDCRELQEERLALHAELESLQQKQQDFARNAERQWQVQRDTLEAEWLRNSEEYHAAMRAELADAISQRDDLHRRIEELQHTHQTVQEMLQQERGLRQELESQILAAGPLATNFAEPVEYDSGRQYDDPSFEPSDLEYPESLQDQSHADDAASGVESDVYSQRERIALASQIPAPEEVCYFRDEEASPTDTAAVLAKFSSGYDNRFLAEELEQELSTSAEPLRDSLHLERPERRGEMDEECAITDYMAELMRRVGGKSMAAEPLASLVEHPKPIPVPRVEPLRSPVIETTQGESPNDLGPRKRMPPIDLNAMRNVANETARVAIDRHSHRQSMQDAYLKWSLAAVSLLTGVGLSIWIRELFCLPTFGAALAYSGAAIWFWQGVIRCQNVLRVRKESHELELKSGKLPVESEAGTRVV